MFPVLNVYRLVNSDLPVLRTALHANNRRICRNSDKGGDLRASHLWTNAIAFLEFAAVDENVKMFLARYQEVFAILNVDGLVDSDLPVISAALDVNDRAVGR